MPSFIPFPVTTASLLMPDAAPSNPTRPGHDRWLARSATLTALLVFPLLFVGAGVTSKDAGMAFPDAPLSNGSLINPDGGAWIRDTAKLWEHSHRLIGWTVGMSAIVSAILGIRASHRPAVRVLAPLVLLAIILQGMLGWKRVWDVSTTWAMVHGVFGQVCFCLAATTALLASRRWSDAVPRAGVPAFSFLRRLCLFETAAVFLQLIMGAALRHFGGGHALVAHVLWAVVVIFTTGWVAMWVLGSFPGDRLLTPFAKTLGMLGATQLILGGAAWLVTLGPAAAAGALVWIVPTAHVAVGALVLVSSLLVTISLYRITPATEPASRAEGAPLAA
jgi:cytochrome c oxidase assembly protein subunit 15